MRSPVMVAVDDTGECEAALDYACVEALTSHTSLELVHVVSTDLDEDDLQVLGDSVRHDVEKRTEGRIEIATSVRRGPVGEELIEASRSARLLVVQHRRESRLQRLQHGSMAVALAGRVHCRMVSVPEDWRLRPSRASGGRGVLGSVTVGVDAIDEETSRILAHAFRAGSREGATLRIVHAWSMSSAYDDALVDEQRELEWSTAYRARLSHLLADLREAFPDVRAEVEVLHQDAARALVELSADSDLLLVGQGRSVHPLIDQLGSVPRAVLRDSSCPVEIVRAGIGD